MAGVASGISLGTIAAAVSAAAAAASVGYALSGAGQPQSPDIASSSAQLSNINALMLPWQRRMQAAAEQGGTITVPGAPTNVQQVLLPAKDAQGNPVAGGGTWVDYNPQDFAAGGKYAGLQTFSGGGHGGTTQSNLQTRTISRAGTRTIDFSGLGTADIQGTIAKQMAQIQLDLSKKYDPQFIAESLKQEQLADPQSFAARQKMSDLIQQEINAHPDRPVATALDQQIGDQLTAAQGGHLDAQMKPVLDDAVQQALAARGGGGAPGADFEQPLVTGAAGEQRKRDAAQKAMSWLSSGATPEDVEYRREQQNLANLSAEVNGQTPESEFKSLSGAQTGPTPFVQGQPLPEMPGSQPGAQSAALNSWQTQMNASNGQAGSWISGISGALNIGSILNAAGYNPTPTNPSSPKG